MMKKEANAFVNPVPLVLRLQVVVAVAAIHSKTSMLHNFLHGFFSMVILGCNHVQQSHHELNGSGNASMRILNAHNVPHYAVCRIYFAIGQVQSINTIFLSEYFCPNFQSALHLLC